jgi:hypothetical protein
MRKREPEGAPEERKRQFEDQRGLPDDSPELPLDPDEEPDCEPDEKDKKEGDTEGGFE